jgi:hypothetical protein
LHKLLSDTDLSSNTDKVLFILIPFMATLDKLTFQPKSAMNSAFHIFGDPSDMWNGCGWQVLAAAD